MSVISHATDHINQAAHGKGENALHHFLRKAATSAPKHLQQRLQQHLVTNHPGCKRGTQATLIGYTRHAKPCKNMSSHITRIHGSRHILPHRMTYCFHITSIQPFLDVAISKHLQTWMDGPSIVWGVPFRDQTWLAGNSPLNVGLHGEN